MKQRQDFTRDSKEPSIFTQHYVLLNGCVMPLVKRVGDGSIIRRFDKTPPATRDTDIVCPHFLELKWAHGCPFDCAWCYLKGTLRFLPEKTKPVVKDYGKVEKHVRVFLSAVETPEILNSGEIADSLMWEGTSEPFSKFIIPVFQEQRRHKVLFVTKSTNIRNLLDIKSHDQAIISFSINATEVAKRWEHRAPLVEQRIESANALSKIGYEVRIRIDPMVPVPDWEKAYVRLIEQVFTKFTPARITLGSLRGLQSTINGCKDNSWKGFLSENSNWGKRVDFATRHNMYRTVINMLNREFNYEKVALCKETIAMWKALGMDYRNTRCNCVW